MNNSLDILNHLLVTVSERPVTTYESLHPSAITAKYIINRVSKEIQGKGWWFNKEYNLILTPDNLGTIIIPSDTLELSPLVPYTHLVQRSGKLYDPEAHTYNINTNVSCVIVLQLPLEDLPNTAFNYIMHKAAFEFFAGDDGDAKSVQAISLQQAMQTAWGYLRAEEMKKAGISSNNRPVSSYLTYRRQQGNNYNPLYPGGRLV